MPFGWDTAKMMNKALEGGGTWWRRRFCHGDLVVSGI